MTHLPIFAILQKFSAVTCNFQDKQSLGCLTSVKNFWTKVNKRRRTVRLNKVEYLWQREFVGTSKLVNGSQHLLGISFCNLAIM